MKRTLGALLDQGALSITAFVVTVSAARLGSPSEFGMIAGLQVLIATLVQAVRQTVGGSLLHRAASDPLLTRAVTTVSVLFASLCGLIVAAACMFGWMSLPLALAFCAAAMGALVQERARLEFQAQHRNHVSGYLGCLVLLLGCLIALTADITQSSPWVPWAGVGVASTMVWGLSLRRSVWPSLTALASAYRTYRAEWIHTGTSFAIQSLTLLGPVSLLGATSGASALAGYRGAQSLVAVAQQVPQALFPIFMARSSTAGAGWREIWRWVAIQATVFLSFCAVFFVGSDELGSALLGQSWEKAEPALIPIAIAGFLASISLGCEISLRLAARTALLVKARLVTVVPQLLIVGVGIWAWGLTGAVWGAVIGQTLVCLTLLAAVSKSISQQS